MDRSASIFFPALPEHLRVALDDALRRWRECGASNRKKLVDYLVGEADEQDAFADRYAARVAAMEAAGQIAPDGLRREQQEARAWAATDRALAGLAAALEVAYAAPVEMPPAGLAAFERLEWLIARSHEPLRQAWLDFLEAREAAPEVTE